MEELTHYQISNVKQNGTKNDHFKLISLHRILFDLGMKLKVDEVCSETAKQEKIKILKREAFPLYKYENVLQDIQNKKALDPIIVKQYKHTNFYEVIDGRHRVVCSLYEGYTHVACVF